MRTITKLLAAAGAVSSIVVMQPSAKAGQLESFTVAPSEGPPHTVVMVSGANCTGPSPWSWASSSSRPARFPGAAQCSR